MSTPLYRAALWSARRVARKLAGSGITPGNTQHELIYAVCQVVDIGTRPNKVRDNDEKRTQEENVPDSFVCHIKTPLCRMPGMRVYWRCVLFFQLPYRLKPTEERGKLLVLRHENEQDHQEQRVVDDHMPQPALIG
jgi:hypothetical protein